MDRPPRVNPGVTSGPLTGSLDTTDGHGDADRHGATVRPRFPDFVPGDLVRLADESKREGTTLYQVSLTLRPTFYQHGALINKKETGLVVRGPHISGGGMIMMYVAFRGVTFWCYPWEMEKVGRSGTFALNLSGTL